MFIVHLTRQFWPGHGGLETVVDNLAKQQVASGHRVRVVTLNRLFGQPDPLPAAEVHDDVEIVRIPFVGSHRYPIAPAVLAHVAEADVVHVHAIDFFFDFMALTKILHRKRLIVSTHGGFFHTTFASRLKQIYFAAVTRLSISRYAFVAASSEHDREIFSRIRGRGMEAIVNGVDCEKFSGLRRQEASRQLIYFGRLAPNKGLELLVPLLRSLRGRDPDWRLVIAGRPMGITVEDLEAGAAAAGVGPFVTVLDTPSHAILRSAIAASSVFVSPSRYEGFGIAAIEAISAGLIPVLSDIAAHRHTVRDTGIGTLVDFDRPDDVAQAITDLRDLWRPDDATAASLGDRLAPYSWKGVAARFEQIYARATGHTERNIVGARINVSHRDAAVAMIDHAIASRTPLRIAFVNAHLANKLAHSAVLARLLDSFCLLNDGIGLDLASMALYGRQFPENLNGTDFTPAYLDRAERGLRLYLLGATEEVIHKAADFYAQRWPRHQVVGCHHGFFSASDEIQVAQAVKDTAPDLVLVAMGNPRQELWLARHIPEVAPVGMAIGALFDFQTGQVRRAPRLFRQIRLEWVYRMAMEPERLWRRYLFGNALFLRQVALQYVRGERA